MKDQLRVSNPPAKPLMIWDGECHFCRRWIERWREITRDNVDYEISQNVADNGRGVRRLQDGRRRPSDRLSRCDERAWLAVALLETPDSAEVVGDADVDLNAIAVPPVFQWLAKEAGIAEREMLRTFNCGIGMVAVVDEKNAGRDRN